MDELTRLIVVLVKEKARRSGLEVKSSPELPHQGKGIGSRRGSSVVLADIAERDNETVRRRNAEAANPDICSRAAGGRLQNIQDLVKIGFYKLLRRYLFN